MWCIHRFKSNHEFVDASKDMPMLFQQGFVRTVEGLESSIDWFVVFPGPISESLLRSVPVIGSILGAGKLYSVWSTKAPEDSQAFARKYIFFHTLAGIFELLGLGIVALILKLLSVIFTALFLCLSVFADYLWKLSPFMD